MPEWLMCLAVIVAWVCGYRTALTVGRIKEKHRILASLRQRAKGGDLDA